MHNENTGFFSFVICTKKRKQTKQTKQTKGTSYIDIWLSLFFLIFGVERRKRKKSCSIASLPIAVADIITCLKDEEKSI
jgi:hypothetical protein